MIDKEIKRKIESKEEVSAEELIKYFNRSPATIEKGLFKKLRQKRATKAHEETQQYLLDNFGNVMDSISVIQMRNFLNFLPGLSHGADLFRKLSENNTRLVELFNLQYGDEVAQSLHLALTNSREAHAFFEKGFPEFYTNTNQYQFNIKDYLLASPLSDQIKPLLFQGMLDSINDRTVRKDDIPFFLSQYLHHEATGSRAVWDRTGSSISSVSEETKQKIQKNISPETALYLVESTDQPLFVRQLLRNFGLDTPEIESYLDTHLDEIITEISEYSRDSLTIKMITQELMENEGINPSEIEYASKGGFGRVFKIGDKILKYGRKAHNAELPYNSELFLQPLLRTSLNGNDFIEVYEEVDVGGSREDMYQLYKALREQGLIWTDIKPENFGRLKKENKIHFDGIDSVNHRAVGFKEDREIPVAQPGDFVLIDLDFVFLEGTDLVVPQEGTAMTNFYEFSARYKREKAAEQNQSQNKNKNHDLDEK